MQLILVGSQSLDELENLAAKNFGLIKRAAHDLPNPNVPTFPPKYLGKFAWVKTISHGKVKITIYIILRLLDLYFLFQNT